MARRFQSQAEGESEDASGVVGAAGVASVAAAAEPAAVVDAVVEVADGVVGAAAVEIVAAVLVSLRHHPETWDGLYVLQIF